jgi:hypothetical protein
VIVSGLAQEASQQTNIRYIYENIESYMKFLFYNWNSLKMNYTEVIKFLVFISHIFNKLLHNSCKHVINLVYASLINFIYINVNISRETIN